MGLYNNKQSSDMYLKSQSRDIYIGTSQWSDCYNTEQSVNRTDPLFSGASPGFTQWCWWHRRIIVPRELCHTCGATRAVPNGWCHLRRTLTRVTNPGRKFMNDKQKSIGTLKLNIPTHKFWFSMRWVFFVWDLISTDCFSFIDILCCDCPWKD